MSTVCLKGLCGVYTGSPVHVYAFRHTVAGFKTYHIKCFAKTRLGKQVQKELEKQREIIKNG